MSSPKNRRQYPRLLTTRPLKLFHRAGGRFLPAVATDLSDGGVLVTITWPCRFIVGEAIDIYLPPDNHVMLSSNHRAPARVVRVLHGEQVTMAAIQFDQPLTQTVLRQERAAA